MWARLALVATAAVAAFLTPSAAAAPQAVACGAVVVQDLVLQSDLTGCETGLVVGADDITIDLNGHSIEGLTAAGGAGIEAVDRSGVTVKNGRVSDFATGVRFLGTSTSTIENMIVQGTGDGIWIGGGDQSHSNRVLRNRISSSRAGVVVVGVGSTLVLQNDIADLEGAGISCRGSARIEGNRVVRAGNGIELFFCSADVVGNETVENTGVGIVRVRSDGLVARNRANANGAGIVSDDSHGAFVRNVTNANEGNGLSIFDSIDTHGPFHLIEDHVAMANGGLGIFSNVEGILLQGKNRARANGDPRECVNVVCN
jgi:Periplasmic copper-binding protein (NosD)